MHVLEDVITWLAAGDVADYRAGVLLLQEHCKNRSLVNNLLKKESDANRQKLFYELVKVLCGGRMEEVSEVMNHFAQAVQGAVPPVQQIADVLVEAHRPQLSDGFAQQPEPEQVPEQLRPQVDDLTQLMSRVYNQRCQLSNSLATLDPADGPRVVGEILALEQQYNALALKRKNVVAAGQQPVAPTEAAPEPAAPEPAPAEPAAPEQPAPGSEPAAPGIDRAELLQQRSNLRSNISKGKGKVKSAKTDAKRLEHQEKVAKWEAELQNVDMQLALPQA